MNPHILRPANLAAAAAAVGGLLVIVLPGHAPSIVGLALVAVAAGAGVHALLVSVAPAWWSSPFDRSAPPPAGEPAAHELASIRAALGGRRMPVEDAPPLPPATLHLLQPLIAAALERSATGRPPSRLLRAVLASEPLRRPPWYRMRRADEEAVADTVHRLLDELDRLEGRAPSPPDHPPNPRAR